MDETNLEMLRARVARSKQPRPVLGHDVYFAGLHVDGPEADAIIALMDAHETLRKAVVEVIAASDALRAAERETLATASAAGRSAHEALEQLYERQRDQPSRLAQAWTAMRALVPVEDQG
jgi:hypothetical protein